MGWYPEGQNGVTTLSLFSEDEIPHIAIAKQAKSGKAIRYPLWSESKANLIQEYIKLFTFITKHGIYIDGFSAPQRRDIDEICSAKLVLENEPKWLREFYLCDIDPKGIQILEKIKEENEFKGRNIHVFEGDFNETIDGILASGVITDRKATFALLDQRTFECKWSTVRKISEHKKVRQIAEGKKTTKIEIFYFLASGWLDRSIAAVKKPATEDKLTEWWGRSDWRDLQGMQSIDRVELFRKRFQDELGYTYATPYAIHDQKRGGRTMYHMVHATDHPEAKSLMVRAYRKVSGRPEVENEQFTCHDLMEG